MNDDGKSAEVPVDEWATVAFIDLSGFSAITDVYGDNSAIAMLELFEGMVRSALVEHDPPIKWIGDEVMLSFTDPSTAIGAIGNLLQLCRGEPRLPLTRTALNHGPVIRRGHDLFGSTVNIAARIAALAKPGQLLATRAVAEAASATGILVREIGETALRSIPRKVPLFEIQVAHDPDPSWIDPVCKMLAPHATYSRAPSDGPWFCSQRCADAYSRSPQTYAATR